MSWLVEDSSPLIVVCVLIAAGSLIALRITQRGKYLVAAGIALLVALLTFVIDLVWVTDVERIQDVVHAIARATARSDADAVIGYLTSDVSIEQSGVGPRGGGELAAGPLARVALKTALQSTKFDYLTVGNIQVNVGAISRQATADFRVNTAGSIQGPLNQFNFATNPAEGSDWSFGLIEAEPGVWKVTRITAVRLPGNVSISRYLSGSR